MSAEDTGSSRGNSGFLMGESAVTLVIIGAALLCVELGCEAILDTLRWHFADERPLAFFGTFEAANNSVGLARGFSRAIGSALFFFGIARLVALAAPGLVGRSAKREPPRAAL